MVFVCVSIPLPLFGWLIVTVFNRKKVKVLFFLPPSCFFNKYVLLDITL